MCYFTIIYTYYILHIHNYIYNNNNDDNKYHKYSYMYNIIYVIMHVI